MTPSENTPDRPTLVRSLLGLPDKGKCYLKQGALQPQPPAPFHYAPDKTGEEFSRQQETHFRPAETDITKPMANAFSLGKNANSPIFSASATKTNSSRTNPLQKRDVPQTVAPYIQPEITETNIEVPDASPLPFPARKTDRNNSSSPLAVDAAPAGNGKLEEEGNGFIHAMSGKEKKFHQEITHPPVAPATGDTSLPSSGPGNGNARTGPFAGAAPFAHVKENPLEVEKFASQRFPPPPLQDDRHNADSPSVKKDRAEDITGKTIPAPKYRLHEEHRAKAATAAHFSATRVQSSSPSPALQKNEDNGNAASPVFPVKKKELQETQTMQLRQSFHAMMREKAVVQKEIQEKPQTESARQEEQQQGISQPPLQQVVVIRQTTNTGGNRQPAAFWERSYMSHMTLRTIR